MLIGYKRGQGSIVLRVKILNSSVSTGAGLTGLTNASTGLIISTIADNEATATAYTVAASNVETITTLGTYAAPTAGKCRFKEVDATNHKGVYEIQIADARFNVSSAKSLLVSVAGATNAAETDVVIPLRDLDPYDAVRAGLTALPNVASGSAGAIITSGTGTAQLSVSSGNITVGGYATGQAPLQPTVAGRTLDVTTTGEAGIDLANVGSPTTTLNLSGTTIAAVSGAVGSVTGNVGGSVASVTGAVGSVTGNVGGNVVGSVASVTARVTANTDQLAGQTVTAANAVVFPSTVSSLTAAGVRSELQVELGRIDVDVSSRLATSSYTTPPTSAAIADAVWDEATAGHTTAGTYGGRVLRATNSNVEVQVTGSNHVAADLHESQPGSIHATTFDAGAIDAAALAADAANEIADALLDRANAIETGLSVRGAFRLSTAALVGKLSGAATTTVTIRNVGDTTNRIVAIVDADGNRSAVTTDAT